MTLAHVWGAGWGLLFGFSWLAFWVLVIVVIVALIRGRSAASEARASPALTLLEQRYARGEIDREEFLERRGVLRREDRAGT